MGNVGYVYENLDHSAYLVTEEINIPEDWAGLPAAPNDDER